MLKTVPPGVVTLLLSSFLVLGALPSVGSTQSSKESRESESYDEMMEHLDAIKEDLDNLKKGQREIQQELRQIQELLRGGITSRPSEPEPTEVIVSVDDDPVKGDETAKVTIIEFSDYQCPFCARFAKETLPRIEDEYIKTGKIKYVFRDFPITTAHKQAVKAAEAANCAGEHGKYWEMHDLLFTNQNSLGLEHLPKYAEVLGLNRTIFENCLKSGKYTREVQLDFEDGVKAGVRGTPTFFIGLTDAQDNKIRATRFVSGAQPYLKFKEAIDSLLNPPKNADK